MAQTIHFPEVPRNILADEAHQKLQLLPSEFLEIPEPLTPEALLRLVSDGNTSPSFSTWPLTSALAENSGENKRFCLTG